MSITDVGETAKLPPNNKNQTVAGIVSHSECTHMTCSIPRDPFVTVHDVISLNVYLDCRRIISRTAGTPRKNYQQDFRAVITRRTHDEQNADMLVKNR